MELVVPELSLVLLVGASGAGKSTFAAKHFAATEVLSSDHYRGVVSNDDNAQDASADAFAVLEFIAEKRLARGLLTVIDATNVDKTYRARWIRLARRYHVLPVAITFELPPKRCQERNADRPDRSFGLHVIRRQASQLRRGVGGLRREGFRYVHRLRTEVQVDAAVIERPRPWTDRRDDAGPFDIIGDVHGCYDELCELLASLGYRVQPPDDDDGAFAVTPPGGRRALFLGDLVDRGPASDRVLHLVMDMVAGGAAVCVPGNHEAKLKRHLEGKQVKLTHGLDRTVEQLASRTEAFRNRVERFIDGLVSHFVLDGGALVVAHAGMREELAGRASGRVRQFALYGETTGEIDEYG
ncbi:MAG: AAA family ATPase, partial [Myxococcota bacterium]